MLARNCTKKQSHGLVIMAFHKDTLQLSVRAFECLMGQMQWRFYLCAQQLGAEGSLCKNALVGIFKLLAMTAHGGPLPGQVV